MKTLRK